MNQMKGLLALGVVGVIAIILVIAYGFGNPMTSNQRTATSIVNPKDSVFELEFEDTYSVTSRSTLEVPIDVKGATPAAGNGITGYHIVVSGVPSFVSNVSLGVKDSYWPVNDSGFSSEGITFYGENADKVLTKDESNFFVLRLTIGTISQSGSFNIAVDLADNAIPSQSHSMNGSAGTKINLRPGTTDKADFSFILPSSVTASGTNFTIPVGLKGSSSSSQVDGATMIFGSIPSYISSCSVSTTRSGWSASGNMVNGQYRIVARGENNPLTASIDTLVTVACTASGAITNASVSITGEAAVVSPQATHTIKPGSVSFTAGTTPPPPPPPPPVPATTYSISGTISGDTKNHVDVSCGSYKAESDGGGLYTITGVPDKTTCTLVPKKNNYIFSPASRQITIQGANVTGQDFQSDDVKGDDGDRGKTGKSGTTTVVHQPSGGSGGTSVENRVAPKSGPAENMIVVSAILIGLIGAVVFIGVKLKWFA